MSVLINPVQLFFELDLNPSGQIKELWNVQKEVLEIYYDSLKDKKKIAIELPTGSGKSITALLILEMWRKAGKRVAILVSSIALGEDMSRRCNDLGIESASIWGKWRTDTTRKERLRNIKKYKRKQAIGIINYWAYMLGTDVAKPDVLIIDDADNFENLLIDQYSLIISKAKDEDIFNQIINALRKYRVYQKLLTLQRTLEVIQLIYFPHSFKIVEGIRKIIGSKPRTDISDDLFWSFRRNGDRIHTYLMFVWGNNIIFTPYIIPGAANERLQNIEQIIFMSATLGTSERIHKTMGSFEKIEIISEKDIKSKIGTMGKRIIFPLDVSMSTWELEIETINIISKIVEKFGKSLILCNSYSHANQVIDHFRKLGVEAILYQSEKDSTFFSKKDKGVLVTAGRFIGLDFPGQACQVEIVPRMPYVLGPVDVLVKNTLEDSEYTNEKVSHRLVQAFGRCNRNPKDYAIYFMLDSRLSSDIRGEEKIFSHFPNRMKAELDFGQEFVEEKGWNGAIEAGAGFLSRSSPEFEKEIDQLESKPSYYQPSFQKPYLKEVQAWFDLSERQNYIDAASRFSECIEFYEKLNKKDHLIERQIAWLNYLNAKCCYLAYVFFKDERYKSRIIEHLKDSIKYGYTSWFSGLQLVINEIENVTEREEEFVYGIEVQSFKEQLIRSWDEFYRSNSTRKRNPIQTWESYRTDLLEKAHGVLCDTLVRTFKLMGFEVRNLSKAEGKPDLLSFSSLQKKFVCLIEVKAKEQGNTVGREDIDQVGGHKASYQREYPDYQVYPIVFTNKEKISDVAIEKAKNNVKILRAVEFVTFMGNYKEIMEKGWTIKHPSERLQVMEKIPTTDDFQKILKPSLEPVVKVEDFDSIVKW